MKKNVLAWGAAIALTGLAGAANAQQEVPFLTDGADATKFIVNPDGVGHIQLVPYYSTQGTRNTLLNIINTDTTVGKTVKVRFRGARNSDDVFDFYVLLSPGDVWRARVYRDGEQTKLESFDNSCTYPLDFAKNGGTAFPTLRVFQNRESEVREGYIEILTAADIVPNSNFYNAIKHVNGVAPCTAGALNNVLGQNSALTTPEAARARGLDNPTSGLIAQWAISDVESKATTSGIATTLLAVTENNVAAKGNIVVAPQLSLAAPDAWSDPTNERQGTADPLFLEEDRITAYFDYPDLSTPYLVLPGSTTAVTPSEQANRVSSALAVTNVINEFATIDADLQTDWVFALPTRRYGVAIDYTGGPNGQASIVVNESSAYFGRVRPNALSTVNGVPAVTLEMDTEFWDDEENIATSVATISPAIATRASLRGEVNVFSFNKAPEDSLLGAQISAQRLDTRIGSNQVRAGWANVQLTAVGNVPEGLNLGLPVIGYASVSAAGNAMSFTWPHRYKRAVSTGEIVVRSASE